MISDNLLLMLYKITSIVDTDHFGKYSHFDYSLK